MVAIPILIEEQMEGANVEFRSLLILCGVLFLAAACESSDAPTPSDAREGSAQLATVDHPYRPGVDAYIVAEASDIGGSHAGVRPATVCAYAAEATYGAGVFEVARLVGVAESDDASPTGVSGFTYITLRTVDPFYFYDDPPTEFVARVPGGPLAREGDGIRFDAPSIELELGARFVGFLRAGSDAYNAGFPDILATRIAYEADDGTWSLHGAVLSTEDLRLAVVSAYNSFHPGEFHTDDCGIEIDFARCPAASLVPEGNAMWDNPYPDSPRVAVDRDPNSDPALDPDRGPDAGPE